MTTLIAATDEEVQAYIALREAVCELEELRKMVLGQGAGSAGEVVLCSRILAASRRVVELAKPVAMFESIAFAGGVLGAAGERL